jgi:hypothetical protein
LGGCAAMSHGSLRRRWASDSGKRSSRSCTARHRSADSASDSADRVCQARIVSGSNCLATWGFGRLSRKALQADGSRRAPSACDRLALPR